MALMSRREITAAAEAEFFDVGSEAARFLLGKADVQRALEMLAHCLNRSGFLIRSLERGR